MTKLRDYYKRLIWHVRYNKVYYSAIVLNVIAGLIMIVYFDTATSNPDKIVLLVTVQLFILLFILINLNYIFDRRMAGLIGLLRSTFGLDIYDNQYLKRKSYFPIEKGKICRSFIRHNLPELISLIKKEHPEANRINVVIGSGTTVAPLFDHLIKEDFSLINDNLYVYTNNLEGIDYIQNHSRLLQIKGISEEKFTLISGFPSTKYRATQGPNALGFFDFFNKGFVNGNEVKVGVLTSNWLLIGTNYNSLKLCARGDHHFQFKKKLVETCDYIVVLAPLGKILRLDNQDKLNKSLPFGEKRYETITFPTNKKVFLHTSFRPKGINSPISRHSDELSKRKEIGGNNYRFFNKTTLYRPRGKQNDIMILECPNDNIRDKFSDFFPE